MEDEATGIYRHLRKIPPTVTEESLATVVQALWSTRNTGLSSVQKIQIQSLLALDSTQDYDLVLVCLRRMNRKSRTGNLSREDIQRLLPLDLASEIRGILPPLFEKCANGSTERASSGEQIGTSPEEKVNAPRLWSRKDDSRGYPAPADQQNPIAKGNFTYFKSMTWTIENPNSRPSDRVAIICLKLQDQTESTTGEVEVKIQLSKDTLEAMLRLISYIDDQLSDPRTSKD